MAKTMKMQDRKNYSSRLMKSSKGGNTNRETSDMSKILSIEYDMKHGNFISSYRRKMYDEYKKK